MSKTVSVDVDYLQRFCLDESSRYALDKPWHSAGWLYATDGRVCVRIPGTSGPTPEGKVPNAAAIFSQYPGEDADWIEAFCPDIDPPEDEAWPKSLVDCDVCHGIGQFCCDSENCHMEHDCCECDGTGSITCYGEDAFKAVDLGSKMLAGTRYLWLLSGLPSCEMSLPGNSKKPIAYRFADGGQALLMPMERSE